MSKPEITTVYSMNPIYNRLKLKITRQKDRKVLKKCHASIN
jgi:hypothetical protein